MPKCLNLTVAAAGACLVVGCATQSKPSVSSARHVPNVRTTAYTHSEGSGSHNAVGTYLSGRHVMSAASDWSRYPLGTRFRIASTNEDRKSTRLNSSHSQISYAVFCLKKK